MTTAIKITRKSRKIGFAWTNAVEQRCSSTGHSYLDVKDPGQPQVVGTAKQCLAEFDEACRINSGGTSWAGAWYVGGKRVSSVDGWITGSRDIARQLRWMYGDDTGVVDVIACVEE